MGHLQEGKGPPAAMPGIIQAGTKGRDRGKGQSPQVCGNRVLRNGIMVTCLKPKGHKNKCA